MARLSEASSYRYSNTCVRFVYFWSRLFVYLFQFLFKTIFKQAYLLLEYSNARILIFSSEGEVKKAIPFEYQTWLFKNSASKLDLQNYRENIALFPKKPLISILMPVYNTPEKFLREAIESVLAQVYENWELCIADDNSSREETKRVLDEYVKKDARIKVVFRLQNGHISNSSNSALEIATGEYVSLFDHDDVLTADALYFIVRCINLHPSADFIYSDEDKINEDGIYLEPSFKPDWSPDSLLSRNYITHFATMHTHLIHAVGGFRAGYEGSQDYDLFLRVTEKTNHIHHIPRILYHWRIHAMSTANNMEAKPYASDAGIKALQDTLKRRQEPGTVEKVDGMPFHYRVHYHIAENKKVSIILSEKDQGKYLQRCLHSILETSTYQEYEIILLGGHCNESTVSSLLKEHDTLKGRLMCIDRKTLHHDSHAINAAAHIATGHYLVFLDTNTEIMTPQWMEIMMQQAQRTSIGAVGGKLLFSDSHIKYAGVIVGIHTLFGYPFQGYPSSGTHGYLGHLSIVNNFSAVPLESMMCKKSAFETVNGFDELFATKNYGIDFCLRLKEAGFRNLFLPDAVFKHNGTRCEKNLPISKEDQLFKERWVSYIAHDPHYNINLTKCATDYTIGT